MEEVRTVRIIKILQWLRAGRRMTTTQICQRFDNEVSIRAIQRDFRLIMASGIPINVAKGTGNENHWSLTREALGFIPSYLKSEEYLTALVLAGYLKVFRGTTIEAEIGTLLKKLEQIVPAGMLYQSAGREIYEDRVVGEFDYSSLSIDLGDILMAILEKRICRVRYKSPGKQRPKTYRVTPVRLFRYEGSLYIHVYILVRKEFIQLKLDRMSGFEVLEDRYHALPKFDPEIYGEKTFGLYRAKEAYQVTLRFDKQIAPHIDGRIWYAGQEIVKRRDGSLILKMGVGLTPELENWILGWVPHVKIVEPDELRESVGQRLKDGLEAI